MKGNARGREKVGDWRCETAEETYLSLNGRENERSSVVQRHGKFIADTCLKVTYKVPSDQN